METNTTRNSATVQGEQHRGYPRPQLERSGHVFLNGQWDFAIDHDATLTSPRQVKFDRKITVPFAPETEASGVNDQGFYKAVWYRCFVEAPRLRSGERLILHFGAVDWSATVWVNGQKVASHDGGYTPFSCDVTDELKRKGKQEIVVRAHDDPSDVFMPRGKQDWKKDAHGIWYPRTTGIWQSVWYEVVPAAYIDQIRWKANVDGWSLALELEVAGTAARAASVDVELTFTQEVRRGDVVSHAVRKLARDSYSLDGGKVKRTINLADPGLSYARHELMWKPETPHLINAEITLRDGSGKVLDRVKSYTAMKQVDVHRNTFLLNGEPYYLRLVLNQGYWENTGMTAPDDEALRRDVELIKELGFNGVRMHQKIEDPRFLYWADKLGLAVWEELPSPFGYSRTAVERLVSTWSEARRRDASHPCIVAVVPVNESWGVEQSPRDAAQRHFQQAIYSLSKSLDPELPTIGNDGWEILVSDILAIHDYDRNLDAIADRYRDSASLRRTLEQARPGGRVLLLDDVQNEHLAMPVMLTEFGGIAYSKRDGDWGYSQAKTPEELADRYGSLMAVIRGLRTLAGYCYTQFTDTYQEANGLVYMDRSPKLAVEDLRKRTLG